MRAELFLLAVVSGFQLSLAAVVSPLGDGRADVGDLGRREVLVDAQGALTSLDVAGSRIERRQVTYGSTPTGPIELGTPPVAIDMIFDTGSDVLLAKTWTTVKAEIISMDSSVEEQVQPTSKLYNSNRSSTYRMEYKDSTMGERVPKKGFIAYGSGVAETLQGSDVVRIGSMTLSNFSISEIKTDTLRMLHGKDQDTNTSTPSGVLGLQHMMNTSLGESIFSRLRKDNMMTAFGYCSGPNNTGSMLWGDTSTEGEALPVVGQMHWATKLGNINISGGFVTTSHNGNDFILNDDASNDPASIVSDNVANNDAASNDAASNNMISQRGSLFVDRYAEVKYAAEGRGSRMPRPGTQNLHQDTGSAATLCPNDSCAAILDTGSNIIAGPTKAIAQLTKQLGAKFDCSNFDSLPNLEFKLGESFKVKLPPSAYMMKIKLPGLGRSPSKRAHVVEIRGEGQPASFSSWAATIEDYRQRYGLDLRSVFDTEHFPWDSWDSSATESTVCMPALVTMNSHTNHGPLWIVGTPLMSEYYVRWAFPQGAKTPTMFIKELNSTTTCSTNSSASFLAEPSMENSAMAKKGSGLMRSEGRARIWPQDERLNQQASAPRQVELDEIRFPHWARTVPHHL